MIGRLLRFLVWCATALALAGFLVLGAHAILAPGTYDPLEASILERASRLAEGGAPFADAAPDPGTALMPGFPLAVSLLVRLFDAALWEPRLLSLLAILAAAVACAAIVRKETNSATLGAAAAIVMLMGQGLLTGSPSSARPESLAILLALGGLCSIRYLAGIEGALLGAFPLAAACFTHPDGLWFSLAALLHLAVHDRRRFAAFAPVFGALVTGAHLLLTRAWGPGYNLESWDLFVESLRFEPVTLLRFLGAQLLGTLGVFTLATVLAFTLPVRPWRGAVGIWTWMGFAALAAAVAATQSGAGALDALRPVAFALALAGPISIQRVTQHLSAWPGSSRVAGQRVMLTALVLQLLTLFAGMASVRLSDGG